MGGTLVFRVVTTSTMVVAPSPVAGRVTVADTEVEALGDLTPLATRVR